MSGNDPVLDVRDLEFRYSRRSRELFGGLTFSCMPGTLTVIEGENGSGKSTLLRLCAGIRKPTGGTITRHGRNGFLPQSTAGLNAQLTGREHIALFGAALGLSSSESQRRADELLDRLRFIHADIEAPTDRLSGGSKQKLSLALTLLDESASMLLLDEPYAGFDTASFTAFIDLLVDLKAAGAAIVMVNHISDPRLPVDADINIAPPEDASHAA